MIATTSEKTVHHDVVVVGGGTAGITVAAQLTKGWFNQLDVAIIEPSYKHYYQPAWTLVGAGTYRKEATVRDEAPVIPSRAKWIKDAVADFHPDENFVSTRNGVKVTYNWLVVAAGIQINWNGIEGLQETIGKNGVCSNYSFETVDSTWEDIRNFEGGTAIFTQPNTPIKCGGAPQKIVYLAEHYFRKTGLRDKTRIVFASPGSSIFAVQKYRETLEGIIEHRNIETMFRHDLIAVHPETKEAVFRNLDSGEELAVHYDMIHVAPPMSSPDFIANGPLADQAGFVDVDKHALQHVRYPNVFGLGDSSNLPTAKTGAAIRKQAPVVVKNLRAAMSDRPLVASYNGYSSCPIVTGYGKMVLAEFDYDKQPAETFPFDQSKVRWSMWLLKKFALPLLYWQGMLKGRA